MLELLWIRDEREAQSPGVTPLRLPERCRHTRTGYSPFGLGLRFVEPDAPDASSTPEKPLATWESWEYLPSYLPAGPGIEVAAGTARTEPLVFVVPFGGRPETYSGERRQPLAHPAGAGEITSLSLTLPDKDNVSEPLRALAGAGIISLQTGAGCPAEVELDRGATGGSVDLGPGLPLRLRW